MSLGETRGSRVPCMILVRSGPVGMGTTAGHRSLWPGQPVSPGWGPGDAPVGFPAWGSGGPAACGGSGSRVAERCSFSGEMQDRSDNSWCTSRSRPKDAWCRARSEAWPCVGVSRGCLDPLRAPRGVPVPSPSSCRRGGRQVSIVFWGCCMLNMSAHTTTRQTHCLQMSPFTILRCSGCLQIFVFSFLCWLCNFSRVVVLERKGIAGLLCLTSLSVLSKLKSHKIHTDEISHV